MWQIITKLFFIILIVFYLPNNQIFSQEEGNVTFSFAINASYPTFADENINKDLKSWLNKYLNYLNKEYGYKEKEAFDNKANNILIEYELNNTTKKFCSIIFTTLIDIENNAHPNTKIYILNYAPTGKRLQFKDLFSDPDQALKLLADITPELVINNLKNSHPEEEPGSDQKLLDWIKKGTAANIQNYQNISIDDEGINIYFSPYQILPYSYGITEVFVPISKLVLADPNTDIWQF